MSEYLYSISGDITGQSVDTYKLHKDIEANLILSVATFRGVVKKDDALYILFDQNIEASEKTALDAIVLNHNSTPIAEKTIHFSIFPSITNVFDTFYRDIGSTVYPGTTSVHTITSIQLFSLMTPGALSYDVQIINRKNNTIIAEQNFTNTSTQLLTFTTINIANIPVDEATITVLARINTQGNVMNKCVHIEQVIIWLD